MNGEPLVEQQEKTSEPVAEQIAAEELPQEDCAAILEANRAKILEIITEWRPRFTPTFEAMKFSERAILIEVPTEELKSEIERSSIELLGKILTLIGLRTKIDLLIKVNEQIRAKRPIKMESKLEHILKANPKVSDLSIRLDLGLE